MSSHRRVVVVAGCAGLLLAACGADSPKAEDVYVFADTPAGCADYIDVLAGSGQRSRFFGDLRCYGQMAAAYVRESNGTQQPYALTGSLFISSADGWDARASKRTLSAATLYIGVDNTSALVFVHATNKASAGTSKVGFALVSMLKRWSTGANVHVFMKDSINMSTFSITANTSGIDVSTDSDCSVIWRIMGAY